jgi:hypothetical protein
MKVSFEISIDKDKIDPYTLIANINGNEKIREFEDMGTLTRWIQHEIANEMIYIGMY